ncbi:Cys-tRNA(Pro) deacylase [Propioniciclava coleopterorum]|uniref:Cys-tRNA(Pro)/Cys-tRNA(Cys) deacylase n=1 Tax=Propioniciclava coleopterorum TaxID=2714937 RepID=A0A6G7YAD4_9ACTN|nr:Cys-tRNA(Pro) deacylase [Propioniciclava coleopterorum]QIK73598.1 Cys-tRNA(Pro) deacylase [Propioniciclava coleopterorum]
MARKKAPGATPALAALAAAGVPFTAVEYTHHDDSHDFGAEAARETGIHPDRIYKTLIVSVAPGRLAVGVVPVSGRLDLKRIAAALGGKKAEMADPRAAERSSGYVLGGVSPLGQRTPLPTVIDASARGWDVMYVSGGKRGLQLGLAPDDLARLTGATFAAIAGS